MQPPLGFAWIEDSLCRTCWPGNIFAESNLLFLKMNGISSVINISGYDFDDQTLKFLSENNISLYEPLSQSRDPFESVTAASSWMNTTVDQLLRLLGSECICLIGSDQSYYDCLLVACLRRVQSWSFVSIISEFRLHSGPSRYFDLEQFIELFQPTSSENIMPGKQGSVHLPEFLVIDHHIRDEERKLLRQYHDMKFKEQAQVIDDSVVVPITTDNKVDRLMAPEQSQSIDSIVVNESEQELASTHEKDQSSSASSKIRNDTTPPVLSPSSNATLKLTKELLFPEGTKTISDHCSFDPALSLIQDKEDDD